jgi:hypothetical protein
MQMKTTKAAEKRTQIETTAIIIVVVIGLTPLVATG